MLIHALISVWSPKCNKILKFSSKFWIGICIFIYMHVFNGDFSQFRCQILVERGRRYSILCTLSSVLCIQNCVLYIYFYFGFLQFLTSLHIPWNKWLSILHACWGLPYIEFREWCGLYISGEREWWIWRIEKMEWIRVYWSLIFWFIL